jgi:mRNA interferase RelE/StbE
MPPRGKGHRLAQNILDIPEICRREFLPSALKEWRKLGPEIRAQFKAHLNRRLEEPHVDSARIRGYQNHYKIKLRSVGYRLVYEVEEETIMVYVMCVGRRDTIYKTVQKRRSE